VAVLILTGNELKHGVVYKDKMGIPSYFRRILQQYPGCLSRNSPPGVSALCFDFNCLIYRCIRAPGMPAFPVDCSLEQQEDWEGLLLKEVVRTVKEVWAVAGRPRQVLLAVDGVVPMAKIRQQRVRRFKSAWLRSMQSSGGWDSNAITPGTAFMDRLTVVLKELAREQGRGWIVSGVREPGEGEHKVMHWIRESNAKGDAVGNSVVVYGLDADLILLSMLTMAQCSSVKLYLLREKQEFGKNEVNSLGEQEYTFMILEEFQKRLGIQGLDDTINYIALMSLMGNDFLPHSLTHKLSDDGHEYIMKEFRRGTRLVVNNKIQIPVLKGIVKRWSGDEEERFSHMIRKKREQAQRGVGKGMDEIEGLPLQWDVEKVFLQGQGHGQGHSLRKDWRTPYNGFLGIDVDIACKEYVKGCQWILDYYLGNSVDLQWMFPSWVPPLWSDLAKVEEGEVAQTPSEEISKETSPEEQLAMVLPLSSWGLIQDKKHRRLPILAPQMWPEKFEFCSVGRRWLWECEALIPAVTAVRLREILMYCG
jgi:5'-3' exonuclease